MLLNDTSLFNKLIKLNTTGQKPVVFSWAAEIIVNGKSYSSLNFISANKIVDCTRLYSEHYVVALQISQSMYHKLLVPNKNNIQLKITKYPNNAAGSASQLSTSYSQIFNAFLIDVSNALLASNSNQIDNAITDDMSGLLEVFFECHDPALFEYRLHEVGGVYKGCTMDELITGLMTHPLSTTNGKNVPVSMIPANNTRRYYQIVIPNGIRLVKLPEYLQKRYGIYSTGLGNYFYKGRWYIFPLLNFKRYNEDNSTLTILNVPPQEMVGNENSYMVEGRNLFVFSSGNSVHFDKSEHTLNNTGRGVKFAIGSNLIDNFREADAVIPVGRNFISLSADPDGRGLENIHSSPAMMTDNPYVKLSEVSAGLGSILMVRWEYANTDLLYPGMPTKILYKQGNVVRSILGTLLMINSDTSNFMNNPSDKRYITVAELTIQCERV